MRKPNKRNRSLAIVRKQFPKVKRVVDSKSGILVDVSEQDNKSGRKKVTNDCALARACVRQKLADAAIIGVSTSYLIHGDTAVRYKTSQSVAREITSFDRHKDFAAGKNYRLSPPCESLRIGAHSGEPNRAIGKTKAGAYKRVIHRTSKIRSIMRD